MKLRLLFFLCALCGVTIYSKAQDAPSLSYQHCYGGSKDDEFRALALTPDGGYIGAGFTQSSDGDLTINNGSSDYWIVKLDSNHNIQWQQDYGGSLSDWARSVECTSDGGYIVGGYSKSIDGDVQGNHGDFDYWILKLDASGNIVWQKSLGGSGFENTYRVIQTHDGNYIVAGFTESNDGNVKGNHGGQDYWIIKLDPNGNIIWKKTFGGSGNEQPACVIETQDHAYVIAGFASSSNGDVTDNKGGRDFWVIKLNSKGKLLWSKSYGGGKDDAARWIEQTPDGGYIVTGYTISNGNDVSGNHGKEDFWVIKIDSEGTLQWQKCYGGTNDDYPYYIHLCKDGTYLVSGFSMSSDGDVTVHYGDEDGWFIKVDSMGNLLWQLTIGGKKLEELRIGLENTNGSFITSGFTASNNDDVSGNHGGKDAWVGQTCIPPIALILNGAVINSCKGSDVSLNAFTAPGYSYQWIKDGVAVAGATNVSYTYTGSGSAIIMVSVTNNLSCSSTSTGTAINRYGKPTSVITPLGDLNICNTGSVTLQANNGVNYTYSWQKNNLVLSGATKRNHTATSTGVYKVTVTDTLTGCSKTSDAVQVIKSCRTASFEAMPLLSVSPNPSNGTMAISFFTAANASIGIVTVMNTLGNVVYQKEILLNEDQNYFTLTLPENIKSGIYLLRINTGDFIAERSVIVRR